MKGSSFYGKNCKCNADSPLKFDGSTKDSIKSDRVRTDIKIISDDDKKKMDYHNAIRQSTEKKPHKLVDTTKRNLNKAVQGNALARLISGIKPKGA